MKHVANLRGVGSLMSILLLTLFGGCILGPDPIGGATLDATTLAAGTYWAEYSSGELSLFRMPEDRDDAGEWTIIAGDAPEWYVEPALYALDAHGTWTQASSGEGQTLDDWLQTWDVGPAVP